MPAFTDRSRLALCAALAFAVSTTPLLALASDSGEPALVAAHDDRALAWGACPDFMPAGCGIALLHGDPAKPNADVFFRVPGGAVIPRHWHSSAERMVLISGELHVTYDGQPPGVLHPGRYAYGPPRHAHEARCAPGDPCVLFIAFEGPVDAIAGDPPHGD